MEETNKGNSNERWLERKSEREDRKPSMLSFNNSLSLFQGVREQANCKALKAMGWFM